MHRVRLRAHSHYVMVVDKQCNGCRRQIMPTRVMKTHAYCFVSTWFNLRHVTERSTGQKRKQLPKSITWRENQPTPIQQSERWLLNQTCLLKTSVYISNIGLSDTRLQILLWLYHNKQICLVNYFPCCHFSYNRWRLTIFVHLEDFFPINVQYFHIIGKLGA